MSTLRNILSRVDASLADRTLAVLRNRYGDEGPPNGWATLGSSVAAFVSYVQDVRRQERTVTDLADVLDVRELRMSEVRVQRAMYVIAPGVIQFSHIVDGMVFDDKVHPSLPRSDIKCPEVKLPQRFYFEPWKGGPLEVALVDCAWFHHTHGTAVTLFTRKASGSSCLGLCLYNDFFYVELIDGVTPEALKLEIENVCFDLKLFPNASDPPGLDVEDVNKPYIVSIEPTRGMLRMNEFGADKKPYLKVTTSSPLVTRRVTSLLRNKFKDRACPLFFNTDEDLADKFLNEKGLASGDIVALAEVESIHMNIYSSCDEVVMCQSAARVNKDSATSPVTMYYDVVAVPEAGTLYPPCCHISYVVVYDEKVFHEGALCLGPSQTYEWYPHEEQVITRFAQIVTATDPDFLVCYGRDNANMVYLMERMRILGIEGFATQLSKRIGHCVSVTTRNAYYGCVSRNVFDCPGRAIVNLADLIKKSNKEVSGMGLYELAKEMDIEVPAAPQEDVDFFQDEDAFQRKAAARVHLIRKLDEATMSTYSVWSMAQVLRMSVSSYLAVGVSGHVMARMRAACAERDFVVSHGALRSKGEHNAVGGKVIEPTPAYHTDPVIVIDFASMYPSIIRAYNICVSTILDEKVHEEFMLDFPNAYHEIDGVYFVKQETMIGLVPSILRGLGEERARLRTNMREAPRDSFLYKALNARQLACKVTMNAFYGVGGNAKLPMYHPLVASTIASKGQALLDEAVSEVKDVGEVIYGDTDSVFVKMRGQDVDGAMDTGRALARDINELMTSPIRIEMECAYKPFVILGKKRYCGAKYTSSGRQVPSVEIKGLPGVSLNKPPFASDMLRRYLDEILLNNDEVAAFEVVRTAATKLLASEFSSTELSLSNIVNKNSEDYRKGKPSFFKALERMRERLGPLRSPCLGERFFYVRTTKEGTFEDATLASYIGVSYPYDLKKYFRTDVVETMQAVMNLVHDETDVSKLLSIDSYTITTKRKAHPGNILTYFQNKRKANPLSSFKYSA